jgi:uncharacterized membrane protein
VDLIIVLVLTAITFPVVTLTEGVPRIILGVLFLLIFPGYTLMAALFPGNINMKGIERAALTLVLSFAVVSLAGLAINYTPWGIRLTPIFIAVSIIIVLASGIALFRRTRIPEYERFKIRVKFKMPRWRFESRVDIVLSIILVIVIVGAIFAMTYVINKPKVDEAFTNFYILGPEGNLENYPRVLTLGEPLEITLGIENQENTDISYSIDVILNSEKLFVIGPLILRDGEKWQSEVVLSPEKAGENQRVEFVLFKDSELDPYLELHLWLDVKE